jgi:hypothetical protein
MILTINDEVLVVKFRHQTTEENRHSECTITTQAGAFVGKGYAKCHPKDNFNKEIGRRKSMEKAMEDASLSKEDRAVMWSNYGTWRIKRF